MVSRADPKDRAASLRCWSGTVDPQPVGGGITNANFQVEDAGDRFFVRIGEDIPLHGVMRFNETAASRAAAAAGLSPEVIHPKRGGGATIYHDVLYHRFCKAGRRELS